MEEKPKGINLSFELLLKIFCIGLGLTLVVSLLLQVFFRFVLRSPFIWVEELSRFILVWITFVGGGIAVKSRGEELRVEAFIRLIPQKIRRSMEILIDSISIVFLIYLIVYGVKMTLFVWGQRTDSLDISFSYVYSAVPLGSAIMLFYLASRVVKYLREIFKERA